MSRKSREITGVKRRGQEAGVFFFLSALSPTFQATPLFRTLSPGDSLDSGMEF